MGLFGISPDGKKLMALAPDEAVGEQKTPQNHAIFLLNFFDEVKRRVPIALARRSAVRHTSGVSRGSIPKAVSPDAADASGGQVRTYGPSRK
jgi:hypothetical protein